MNIYFYVGAQNHPFFREQLVHPPEGITYIPSTEKLLRDEIKRDYVLIGSRWFRLLQEAKQRILDSKAFAFAGIPQLRYIRIPKCDAVYTRHLLLNPVPWIIQVEEVTALAWYRRRVLQQPWARKAIERSLGGRHCKAILPWTQAAAKSLENALDCSTFRHKIRVVYPAIAPASFESRRNRKQVRFLFIAGGSRFYPKGGVETLQAFDRLSRSNPNVSLRVIAYAPPEIKELYAKNSKITFSYGLSPEALREEFRAADVFVLPTHVDSILQSFLEAFAYGIPCIGTSQFSMPEIVTDGVTGWLVKPECSFYGADFLPAYDSATITPRNPFIQAVQKPSEAYVAALEQKMSILADDASLRQSMSEAAYEEVLNGKFSVSRRKIIMREVFDTCLPS